MSAIDVDATMAPMNYEVMTDNEPILILKTKKKKKKINLGPTFIWHILAINLGPPPSTTHTQKKKNLGPMHKYADKSWSPPSSTTHTKKKKNLGPMHNYAAGSSPSSNMKMNQPCRVKHFCFTICYCLQFFWSSKS